MAAFDLQELRLKSSDGKETDFSTSAATLTVVKPADGLGSWSIYMDTSGILDPNVASYEATMLTTDGQQFAGTVLFARGRYTSASDNTIILKGTGPLHGYASA